MKDLDGRACLTHGRPLELYSRAEGRCVCALCVEEGHEVISVEMEWDRKKVSYFQWVFMLSYIQLVQ